MRLQLVERKRPLNAGVAADPAKLETGAQITSVKAHMLLWRRTLECCVPVTLTLFAADRMIAS